MADVRAYYKNDVGYFDNPKVAPLVEDHPRAVILHQRAIAYCAQHLTNGTFPMRQVMRLVCASQCDLDLLVQYGLVIVTDDVTAEVHDYLEHNRSAEDVKRAKAAGQKGAAGRWADKSDADSNADGMRKALPTPMPREREREREEDVADAPTRLDVEDLCKTLADLIEANGSKRPTITKTWRTQARLMLDTDNRGHNDAKALMRWTQSEKFWAPNIMSMGKFREKYDTLRLQADRDGGLTMSASDRSWLRPGPALIVRCDECERPLPRHFARCSQPDVML